uniref:Uncharacterized protein n=1 Tax=Mimivirus LCMiAC01 TaxID=2506608 RepID=A0A481Z0U7_9VIRU|nr:MAG: hypothetical protein LCMiAC01_05620 [Mimivirus LCMiAC01]
MAGNENSTKPVTLQGQSIPIREFDVEKYLDQKKKSGIIVDAIQECDKNCDIDIIENYVDENDSVDKSKSTENKCVGTTKNSWNITFNININLN